MGRNPSSNVEIYNLNSINKLKDLIKGRIVCIIARGKTAEILEKRIEEFKNYDVVWTSMNLFTPAEMILEKIGKQLDLVSDCSTVKNIQTYERDVRMPRFIKYLKKDNNLLFTSQLVIQESFKRDNFYQIFGQYKYKIATIDDIFNTSNAPKSIWDAPPNSITLLFAACIAGGAKKIICFGYDGLYGHTGTQRTYLDHDCIETYYRSDLEKKDRLAAAGAIEIGSLATDSFFFQRDFSKIWNIYKQTYNNDCPILNCSPITKFTCIKKISYDEVHNEIR